MSDRDDFEHDYSADEFLDWLCWMFATEGERFYPPKETAWECVEALMGTFEDTYEDDTELMLKVLESYHWEEGQHGRAWMTATMFFDDAYRWGFDPVMRTERHIEEAREDGLDDLPDVDWEWLRESGYSGDVPDQ